MNLLLVTGTLSPICGDEPLGRMMAQLGGSLCGLGHKVVICAPVRDPDVLERYCLARHLTPLELVFPHETVSLQVFDGRLPTGVEVRVVAHEGLFQGRPAVTDGGDEPLRHAALCQAAVMLASAEGLDWHVIHGVGLPGALMPLLASRAPALARAKTALLVDRLDLRGQCDKSWVERLGLGWEEFTPEGFEFFGDLSLLKAGLVRADRLIFDSLSRMNEALTPEGGSGLEGLLEHRRDALCALPPGLDAARWNPATDPLIPARFDAEQPDGKRSCKAELQHRLGLPVRSEAPLIGLAPPLDDLGPPLARVLERLFRSEVQIVAPAGLNPTLDSILEEQKERWPRGLARCPLDDRGWHELIAGADLMVLDAPRRSEADLLLASLRYGALPVVRPLGLARDLAVDLSPDLSSGNAFIVQSDDPSELVAVLRRAVATLAKGPRLGELVRRVMSAPPSWEDTARRLEQIHAELFSTREDTTPA